MPLRKPPEPGSLDSRLGGMGLVLAPMVFIVGWNVGGRLTLDYSPMHQAISRIAAVGAPQRSLMTAAFVGYSAWILAAIPAVRRTYVERIWPALLVNGLATLAVAALALDRSHIIDVGHGVAATAGYLSLAAVPILGAKPLKEAGFAKSAMASWLAAAGILAFLLLTLVLDAKGFAQRAGLTIGDVWLACTGFAIVTGRLSPAVERDESEQAVEPGDDAEEVPV